MKRLLVLLLITLLISIPFSSLKMNALTEGQGVDGKPEEVEYVNGASESEKSTELEVGGHLEDSNLEQNELDHAVTEELPQEDEQKEMHVVDMTVEPTVTGTPAYYEMDPNAIVVTTQLHGQSTNSHTKPHMLWAKGEKILVAVKSTHKLQYMTLNQEVSISIEEHAIHKPIAIHVDDVIYAPDDGLQGNTKDARWTVFTFKLSDLNLKDDETYPFFVKGIGGGHDVGGTIGFFLPKTDVTAKKVWVDGTERPAITLKLMAQVGDEEKRALRTGEVTGAETPEWTYEWKDVPAYDPYGRKYSFTADEKNVPANYEKSIDGLTVTNTYKPEKMDIDVEKRWIGPAAESVTVQLYADGVHTGKSIKLDEDSGWVGSFTGLNKLHDKTGDSIHYMVAELEVEGYTSQLTGSAAEGFVFTNRNDETINVGVEKRWIGPAAESVQIILLVNGEETQNELILSESNDWTGAFNDLRKYDAETGEEISYSVKEINGPQNYDVSITKEDGKFIVTNQARYGSLTVEKVDAAGKPLAGATFELRDSDGNVVDTLTTDENRKIKFEDLEWGIYSLIETKAPEGYNKLAKPIEITIDGENLHVTQEVVNTTTGWILPSTGGVGTIGFYVVGFMLMVFGLWAIVRKNKLNLRL
ncbi:Cna B-type domain-containing protein [Sporosarcina pasteurii]|uniref:Collagen adhesin n=1 Tax=Sporosarcina pasteurii TaxID=1474 RepID=A0A380BDU4_SPOPA|nr:Cna B-type domain-containing protein [Sporosarcina pasteurii]MDS9472632.1 Cna B-type domain-containing protein [Sporosarcina pasteurii]QBQ06175.1 Cna B-type domain-containing protein [Sporosarcina pasteurii]SUI99260.1 Collagen adhesin precursor [Sporosarcina pasteurii]